MTTVASWPIPSHFSKMLQNPAVAFRDAELKRCRIERDGNGQPRARAGAFANVYKGTFARGGDVALRVFTRPSDERRERYRAISEYLSKHRLRSLVGFEYHEKGIRVADAGGRWYPLVTMEWVDGDILFDWVRSCCYHNQPRPLGAAAEKWVELIRELAHHRIAHGDLQHGNVMVTPAGQLRLVDYDCMCVPALEGRRNLEIGVEPYQHPERDERTPLFFGLDNFSALYIHVVLRALAVAPALWRRYNEPAGGELHDKLLFRREDFEAPTRSPLYQDLRRSPDEKVRKWADDLFGLVRVPLRDVPPLEHFVNDYETVRQLLSRKAWDEALEIVSRGNNGVPPDLQAPLAEARRRVAARQRLEAAVRAGDEQEMQRTYDPRLLDDDPKSRALTDVAKVAAQVIPVLRQLEQARADGRRLVAIWDAHKALLTGRRSAEVLAKEVEPWRRRNALCDVVLRELSSAGGDAAALKAAWRELQQLGGHPEVAARRAEVERAIARQEAFQRFRRVAAEATAAGDAALVAAWQESLFAGWPPAERERPRVAAAAERRQQYQAAEAVVRQQEARVTLDGERAISQAASVLPAGYEPVLHKRLGEARDRLQRYQELEKVVRAPSPGESDLAGAWQGLVAAGGAEMVGEPLRGRLELAARRAPVLAALRAIPPSVPVDRRDRELLRVWDESLLAKCLEADLWRAAWRDACHRRTLLGQLDAALAADDPATVVACTAAPLLYGYPFPAETAERIRRARETAEAAEALVAALKQDQPARFAELFDAVIVDRYAAEFEPYRERIGEWVAGGLLSRERVGLGLPIAGQALRLTSDRRVQLRWTWPQPRFSEKCLLAVCRREPAPGERPDAVAVKKWPIARRTYEGGGGYYQITPRPEWRGMTVAVWGVVELAFATFHSEPVVLGKMP